MQKVPKCESCGISAEYDVPIPGSGWAYLCALCKKQFAPTTKVGSRLIKASNVNKGKTFVGKLEYDSVYDWYVTCKGCEHDQLCESDAESVYCTNCGAHIEIK